MLVLLLNFIDEEPESQEVCFLNGGTRPGTQVLQHIQCSFHLTEMRLLGTLVFGVS